MQELEKAKKAALRLLAFRPRSENELRRRLAEKKLTPQAIEQTVSGLRREGMLDDARFAKLYALSRLQSRGFGKVRVRRELTQRGLSGAQIEKAMSYVADLEETDIARELARKRLALLKGLPASVKRRRLHGVLLRRGFSAATSFKVLGELLGNAEEVPE